ncbi:MAG: YlmH/Sll1252 family protein [Clostridia bacterium]|nr:YlmH/Sll1252 family protein [Clostridia bacterium]
MNNDKLLIRRISDISTLADKYNMPRFSDFLDEGEQAEIKATYIDNGGVWYGGYETASRRMIGFFPDWCEADYDEFPIAAVKIENKGNKNLTHRDYLGTIMSLGLERKKIGDISVSPNGAYVFVSKDMADVVSGIEKISNCGVRCKIVPITECEIAAAEFEMRNIVAASMRLDAVLAALLKVSRKKSSDLIAGGKCAVNHLLTERSDYILCEGDLLSVRGFGRAEIVAVGSKTRSDRLHITIKKFI